MGIFNRNSKLTSDYIEVNVTIVLCHRPVQPCINSRHMFLFQSSKTNARSTSMSRTTLAHKRNKKSKKKKGPIEQEDIENDQFLKLCETVQKEKGISLASPDQFWNAKRKVSNQELELIHAFYMCAVLYKFSIVLSTLI